MDEFNQVINLCIENRSNTETNLNNFSTRSHVFFNINLRIKFKEGLSKELKISIIDLAGSERSKRTDNYGILLNETCNINKSLMFLGQCIQTWSNNSIRNETMIIPYRNCKLTKLMYEFFDGNSFLAMIANINPAKEDFEENLRVLHYTSITKEILPLKSRIESGRKERNPFSDVLKAEILKKEEEIFEKDNKIRIMEGFIFIYLKLLNNKI